MNSSPIKNHYNSVAEDYQKVHQFPERIIDLLDIAEDMSILDIGCGSGNFTFELSKAFKAKQIIGIDFSYRLIELANKEKEEKRTNNIDFQCSDARDLPFTDQSFDVITSNMVFHLFDNQYKTLKEWHRVLKPGGKAVFQFQGQRPVAPEYFALLEKGWKQVFCGSKVFPVLFQITDVNRIDEWMKMLLIEKFDVHWRSNTVRLNKDQFQKFLEYIPLVSGFWKSDLNSEDVSEIENSVLNQVEKHFETNDLFELNGNTLVLSYTKPAI